MTIRMEDSGGRPLAPGDVVAYHGSLRGRHGGYEVHRHCWCPGCLARWQDGETVGLVLSPLDGYGEELECVRPASVTLTGHPLPEQPVDEMWQAKKGDVLEVPCHWARLLTVTGIEADDPAYLWVTWEGERARSVSGCRWRPPTVRGGCVPTMGRSTWTCRGST